MRNLNKNLKISKSSVFNSIQGHSYLYIFILQDILSTYTQDSSYFVIISNLNRNGEEEHNTEQKASWENFVTHTRTTNPYEIEANFCPYLLNFYF